MSLIAQPVRNEIGIHISDITSNYWVSCLQCSVN